MKIGIRKEADGKYWLTIVKPNRIASYTVDWTRVALLIGALVVFVAGFALGSAVM